MKKPPAFHILSLAATPVFTRWATSFGPVQNRSFRRGEPGTRDRTVDGTDVDVIGGSPGGSTVIMATRQVQSLGRRARAASEEASVFEGDLPRVGRGAAERPPGQSSTRTATDWQIWQSGGVFGHKRMTTTAGDGVLSDAKTRIS